MALVLGAKGDCQCFAGGEMGKCIDNFWCTEHRVSDGWNMMWLVTSG